MNSQSNDEIIKVKRLNKFLEDKQILKSVSFSIVKDDFHVLIGNNGAGKSTLIKCLINVYQNYYGEITFNGINVSDFLTKNKVSYISDKYNFPKYMSVKSFLIWNSILAGRPKKKILSEISYYFKKLGLFKLLTKNPNKLSSGEKQMVLLIKIILEDAEIIILDEPTSNLDPKYRIFFFELIKELNNSKTILICTHELHEINEHAKSVTILDDGKVVFSGYKPQEKTLSELFEVYSTNRINNNKPKDIFETESKQGGI